MESEPNPYATPEIAGKSVGGLPKLPMFFRPRGLDYFFLVPIGIVVGAVFAGTSSYVIGRILQRDLVWSDLLIATLAVLFGIAFSGFFSAVLSCVKIDSTSVRITQLKPEYILFKDVQSWHFQPVTKCVVISFRDSRSSVTLNNYVMTPERSEVLAKVLRKFVGPSDQE